MRCVSCLLNDWLFNVPEIEQSVWSGIGFRGQGFAVGGSLQVFRHFGPFVRGTRVRAVHLFATSADNCQLGFRVAMHASPPIDDGQFLAGELLTLDSHALTGMRIQIDSSMVYLPVFLNYDVQSSRQFLVCEFLGITTTSTGGVSVELG